MGAYNYLVYYKENHDYITIMHDFYNALVTVYYNREKIFQTNLKKIKTHEKFEFEFALDKYELDINTHHFLFFKKDKIVLKENGITFKKQKFKSKSWDVSTKKADYHIHILYNDFTSSMKLTINDDILYDSLDKVKAIEPSVRKFDYDGQVIKIVKQKVENELFSLGLKMNARDIQYCKEDLLFINCLALLKRNSRNVKFITYLKTKLLELIVIPIFLLALFALHVFLIQKFKFKNVGKVFLTFGIFIVVVYLMLIGFYIIGYKFYKKRFKN